MVPAISERPIFRRGIGIKNFVLPTRYPRSGLDFDTVQVCAIVPTYKPEPLTVTLVEDLVKWNPRIRVIVIDDCTPPEYTEGAQLFGRIAAISKRVTLLRTSVNTLKAGALNHALEHIFKDSSYVPDVVLSLDDDVVIAPSTVRNLVLELMSYDDLGAVCSQCRVLNKDKNILTRLQGLEYVGFNATRLADEGFYWGPLVMHGMLTAFRVAALRQVGKFAEGHLIEDYEITTRLKSHGWSVKSAVSSPAWTQVPESFAKLWLQRTRWSYGGITVIARAPRLSSVLQDLIGHGTFFAMLGMILLLLVFRGDEAIPVQIARGVIILSFLQFALWYAFLLWLMRLYKERDTYDWILRISLLPEFVYTNILTLIVIGSYLFLLFNILTHTVTTKSRMVIRRLAAMGAALFAACGYTKGWGTRTN